MLEEVGGAYYITVLTARVNSAAHLEYHARIVVQIFLARELIRISSEIQTKAFDDKTDVDDLMQEAEGLLFEVAQGNLKKDVIQINPVIEEARERMFLAAKSEGASGVPSGFHSLDKITSGWQKSDLIIIAARPAMGKTSFSMNIVEHVALVEKKPVLVFSMEMGAAQLAHRMLGSVGKIDQQRMRKGTLNNEDWVKVTRAVDRLQHAQIFIDETPGLNPIDLRARARR